MNEEEIKIKRQMLADQWTRAHLEKPVTNSEMLKLHDKLDEIKELLHKILLLNKKQDDL